MIMAAVLWAMLSAVWGIKIRENQSNQSNQCLKKINAMITTEQLRVISNMQKKLVRIMNETQTFKKLKTTSVI